MSGEHNYDDLQLAGLGEGTSRVHFVHSTNGVCCDWISGEDSGHETMSWELWEMFESAIRDLRKQVQRLEEG